MPPLQKAGFESGSFFVLLPRPRGRAHGEREAGRREGEEKSERAVVLLFLVLRRVEGQKERSCAARSLLVPPLSLPNTLTSCRDCAERDDDGGEQLHGR